MYRLAAKRFSRNVTIALTAITALNLAFAFISGGWGQIDQLLGISVFAAAYLFMTNRRVAAGAVYGLAILLKPQALMVGPLFAVAYVVYIIDSGKDWKRSLGKNRAGGSIRGCADFCPQRFLSRETRTCFGFWTSM